VKFLAVALVLHVMSRAQLRGSSASRWPAAAAGSMRPSRVLAAGFRLWSSLPVSMAAASRSAPRRLAACAQNSRCRGRDFPHLDQGH